FRSAFICGVDLSYSLLKEGRKIHKLSVFNCSALTLPFKNHSFELIIMNGTFNQIKEKKKLLDEIKRISSNISGDLIVCDIYKKDKIVEIEEGTTFNINCAFTKDGLLSFFEKSGFKFINAVFADDYTKDLGVFSGLWKVH
ncbi:MAG: class I SAM-dependent methyltransferase, partial [Proteobacteria bacterium]|nr:class I SAM-dependent methyltransferase [Pseudomonadota bacterium]